MVQTADLQIATDILPLFDFTCSDHAQQALAHLLTNLPSSLAEILRRQEIIKACIAQNGIIGPFSYPRIDMNEVYEFLASVQHDADMAGEGVLHNTQLGLRLRLSTAEKLRFSARINQLVSLFYRLHTHYFSRIDIHDFPEGYRQQLNTIKDFLDSLSLATFESGAREGTLKVRQLLAVFTKLQQAALSGALRSFWTSLFTFEAYLSAASGIMARHFCFPAFVPKGIGLKNFYHPLVKNAVKNNLDTESNVILLTGPNMSGKSTLLKAVGLCIYLAHAGLGVPAAACTLPFFHTISIAINASDDLKNGYSHFLNEIITLKNIVTQARAGMHCFAVFDEIFKGTNTEDALAITQTTIAGLGQWPGSYFFISTHLHQLQQPIAALPQKPDCYCIDCTVTEGRPAFTYRLQKGWSDLKIGRLLFELEGLDKLLG